MMALLKIRDFDPNYTELFDNHEIIGYSVYSDKTGEKIGTVQDILVNEDDYNYEELVRAAYLNATNPSLIDPIYSIDPLGNLVTPIPEASNPPFEDTANKYDRHPRLYHINEEDRPSLKSYSERLLARKNRITRD